MLLLACSPTQPSISLVVSAADSHTLRVGDHELTTNGDRAGITAWVASLAPTTDVPAVDATLTVHSNGALSSTASRAGRILDVSASVDAIVEAIAADNAHTQLVIRDVMPAVSEQALAPVRSHIEHLLAHPPALTFENQRLPLIKEDVAPMVRVQGAQLHIDAAEAEAFARLMAAEFHRDAVDARFAWKNGGKLEVLKPSAVGRDLDVELAIERITTALVSGSDTISMPVFATQPSVPSTEPEGLGIVELIERGSTSFAGSVPEKKANIKLAAERLNGVVVPPHGAFSFNEAVGPTTLEAGFQWGFAIAGSANGPKTVPSVGGGICQVATTLFQPVFWAGYQLEERRTHSYWIPAYASRGLPGLDVTVDADANMDFRWTNPTDDYVLIQSSIEGETVSFALYGRKPTWQVSVSEPEITNTRPSDPTPVREDAPGMAVGRSLQVSSARDGFDVQLTRVVTPADGADTRTLRVRTSYQPSRAVTLVGIG